MARSTSSKTTYYSRPFHGKAWSVWWSLMVLVLLVCPAGRTLEEAVVLEEYRPVFDLGSFSGEKPGTLPEGWAVIAGNGWPEEKEVAPADTWSLQEGGVPGGGASVCMTAAAPVSLVSPLIPVNKGLQSLAGSITATGTGNATVTLYWMVDGGVLETVALRGTSGSEGRRRFNLSDSERPDDATAFQVVLVAPPEAGEGFCWQTARFTGVYTYTPEVTLMVNCLGYEQIAPKNVTVRSNFPARTAYFTLTNELGDIVYKADLGPREEVRGTGGAVWDDFYCQGDFTDYEKEGTFTLTATLDECAPVSKTIRIRFNLFWEEAFLPAVQPFQEHRVAAKKSADGVHLWEDPGVNAASDAVLLWSLVHSWSLLQGRYPKDPPLLALEKEAFYGVNTLAAWVLQGNVEQVLQHEALPFYLNALTCAAHYRKDAETVQEAAECLMQPLLDEKRGGTWFFFAAMDLYDVTGAARYLAYAKEIYPGIVLDRVECLLDYEYLTDTAVTVFLREAFSKQADILLTNAANPFGLVRSQHYDGKGFFTWNEGVKHRLRGNTVRLLAEMQTAAQAYRYSAHEKYLAFVYNQLNWLLGNNPFGRCLVSGLCSTCEPPVAHPDQTAPDPAGAFVLHGTGPQTPDLDVPRFSVSHESPPDANTNGYSLYNNAQYIKALAYLKRIPVVQPR